VENKNRLFSKKLQFVISFQHKSEKRFQIINNENFLVTVLLLVFPMIVENPVEKLGRVWGNLLLHRGKCRKHAKFKMVKMWKRDKQRIVGNDKTSLARIAARRLEKSKKFEPRGD